MARYQLRPEAGMASTPACAMYDEIEAGQSAALNNGVTRDGNLLMLAGYRRYRLKIVQLTGAGPTAVNLLDVPFTRVVANAWENFAAIAAMPAGTRSVVNFGEGTANLTNFMGPYLVIRLLNNGGNAATYQLELWAQA